MTWLYTMLAVTAVVVVLIGAIGGGVWWLLTAVGLIGIGAYLVVDRRLKQREPGSDQGPIRSAGGA